MHHEDDFSTYVGSLGNLIDLKEKTFIESFSEMVEPCVAEMFLELLLQVLGLGCLHSLMMTKVNPEKPTLLADSVMKGFTSEGGEVDLVYFTWSLCWWKIV